jgi:hypothetical protein
MATRTGTLIALRVAFAAALAALALPLTAQAADGTAAERAEQKARYYQQVLDGEVPAASLSSVAWMQEALYDGTGSASADQGFAWADAAVGAGVALGVIVLAGGLALMVRRSRKAAVVAA